MGIEIEKISNQSIQKIAWAIRKEVFVIEQACPEDLEWEFEEESTHFIAKYNAEYAGTARYRKTGNGYKLERIAVLKQYRKHGIASALIQKMLKELPMSETIYLHAQTQAKVVYDKNNFTATGPLFDEAGIEHIKMIYQGSLGI
jgi:predicted GNAT family N-acyltransferase